MKHPIALLSCLFVLSCNQEPNEQKESGAVLDTEDTGGGDSAALPPDADGDGFAEGEDCNDADPAINAAAEEVCDGIDNDCDGVTDPETSTNASTWYADTDGDGYGNADSVVTACEAPEGHVATGDDCDDGDDAIHPGAEEADCADPVDYNCDGSAAYADADADGWAACEECDDADPAVNPDADESCDGIDNDCDGVTDPDSRAIAKSPIGLWGIDQRHEF